ncbi:MAG: flavodoxin-dependent (E)-4-hydroxy-3-methylbut-2-enyl-diphosphate synthase [Clostridiales bacterium]|nr:flavodoxin-dependent (E)-4-hydroxy-3-methylbut-2-enyl-diphosphate synthase [Clostridiales bacterium]
MKNARNSKKVKIGNITIGGGEKIAVQSMLNVDTHDFAAVFARTRALEQAGCDIIRLAVPDRDAVKTIFKLKEAGITAPLVADIHFDYKIAVDAAYAGIDKIRINPGNIGADENVKAVVTACREKNVPIRIGVNSGSLEKSILAKYGAPTAEALAESALYHATLLEKFDFTNTVISVKSSDVMTMIEANRILAEKCDYPLHLGVTEAGTLADGTVKSAIGIGTLLCEGIGDTIRVSLTDKPEKEVFAANDILRSIGLYEKGYYNVISCPTCGRTKINLIQIANEVKARLDEFSAPTRKINVAVMGCVVNGPGEAAEADIGIAGGIHETVVFEKGKIIKKIPESETVDTLISIIKEKYR